MTRRELAATIIAALLVVLSMYQCGAGTNARRLKQDALAALNDSRAERDALRARVAEERMFRELGALRVKGLEDSVAALTLRSALIAGQARTIRIRAAEEIAAVERQHARDTAALVPRARLDDAITAATSAMTAAALADSARLILADSVGDLRDEIGSVQAESSRRIIAALDSVKVHLAREDARQPAITAGVKAGSARCGWGPWRLIPCVSRTAAFVGGAVVGALAMANGDQIVGFVKQQLR